MGVLRYLGYEGSAELDLETGVVHGKILFIDDLVTYETSDVSRVGEEFRAAVDDYLATCKELGREPKKSLGGVFNVRTTPENHRALALRAAGGKTTLNAVLNEAIDLYLANRGALLTAPVQTRSATAVMEVEQFAELHMRSKGIVFNSVSARSRGALACGNF